MSPESVDADIVRVSDDGSQLLAPHLLGSPTYRRNSGRNIACAFRAVDKHGRLIDFMLSDRRNTKAARRFLAKALKVMRTRPPVSITTDKLGSYPKALRRLRRKGELKDTVRHRTSKYLNNRIEADHGALKRLIRPEASSR